MACMPASSGINCFCAGASDCASCVGVLLELARVLVANPAVRLSSPVVFLFNGAEETFLQARM